MEEEEDDTASLKETELELMDKVTIELDNFQDFDLSSFKKNFPSLRPEDV